MSKDAKVLIGILVVCTAIGLIFYFPDKFYFFNGKLKNLEERNQFVEMLELTEAEYAEFQWATYEFLARRVDKIPVDQLEAISTRVEELTTPTLRRESEQLNRLREKIREKFEELKASENVKTGMPDEKKASEAHVS